MRRPALVPATAALVVLLSLWAIADRHPVVRPLMERFAVLTLAGAVLGALAMAAARAHPEPAVTALDRIVRPPPEPEPTPVALRRIAATFAVSDTTPAGDQDVGGRALIHRIGRERLRARGLDPDDPAARDEARVLTGDGLWALISTPPDQPVPPVDLPAALDRLEAL